MRILFEAAVFVGIVSGCGGNTAKDLGTAVGGNAAGAAPAGQSGSHAAEGARGGSGGLDGTGGVAAGGSASVGVGGSTGEPVAGAVGSSGMATVVDCGTSLIGRWVAEANDVREVYPPRTLDQCSNLKGSFTGGNYYATTDYPYPEKRVFALEFDASGYYVLSQVLEGALTLDYPPACLATPDGTPTCDQLQATLYESGIGEGAYFDTACVARGGGGCTCSVRAQLVGGDGAEWQVDGKGGLDLRKKDALTGAEASLHTTYQACGTALHFDATVDEWWHYASSLTFSPVNCTDSKQGPGEDGVDCGFVCKAQCK